MPFFYRVLGALAQQLTGKEVWAYLVYEEDLNQCLLDGHLQIDEIERKFSQNFKPTGSKAKFIISKDKSSVEACFQSLQIDNKQFVRPTSEKQVHEEKYRIVFITKLTIGNSTEVLQVGFFSFLVWHYLRRCCILNIVMSVIPQNFCHFKCLNCFLFFYFASLF